MTRLVSLCGAELPRTLLGALAGENERGFWESLPLIEFNDEVLAAAGRVWHDLRPIPPAWFATPRAVAFVPRLAALIRAEFGAPPVLVIKDPRLCRLVPLYRAALDRAGIRPVALIPVRHPLEVAASISFRNGFGWAKSVLLWLEHVLAAEWASRGLARRFVTFGQALDQPVTTMEAVGAAFGLAWPRAPAAAAAEMAAFLAPELRHQRRDDDDLRAAPHVPDEAKDCYAWLVEAAQTGREPRSDVLERLAARLRAAGGMYRAAVMELEEEARTRDATLKHRSDAVERDETIQHLRREVARLRGRV